MSFFLPQLAIDPGTWKTRVFSPTHGGVIMDEPSLVAFARSNHEIVGIGEDVVEMVGKTPHGVEVVRPFNHGSINDYRTAEVLFKYAIEKGLSRWQFFKPEILLSAPVGVTAAKRRASLEVALSAGARNAFVIQTPVLAALGAGIEVREPGGHMIVDVGAGTVDIAVISLGGIVSSRSLKSAGLAMDRSIREYIKRKYSLDIGERTADRVKRELGSAHKPVDDTMEVRGVDIVTGDLSYTTVTGKEIAEALRQTVGEISSAIKETLHSTPPELASDIMDKGIMFTGAGSELRGLSNHVQKETGVTVTTIEDPGLATIRGAGKALEHIGLYKRSILVQ